MGSKLFRMEVYRQQALLVYCESSDACGIITACERWAERGYEVKLYRVEKHEIDWKG